jgi:hypothetical protein
MPSGSGWFKDTWERLKKTFNPAKKENPESLDLFQIGLPSDGHIVAFGHFTSQKKYLFYLVYN